MTIETPQTPERREADRRAGKDRRDGDRRRPPGLRGLIGASIGFARTFPREFWGRLSVPERVAFLLVPPAIGGAIVTVILIFWLGGPVVDFLAANLPLVRFVVAASILLLMTVPTAFILIYLELKVIARMNLRVGPNRVGPWGAAMSVIHGLKVLTKEDFAPTGVDITVFTLAPVVTYLASVMTLLVIPFAPGLIGQDLNVGLLYFFAMGGLTVVGLLMAGWSSFNKYSLLGGLRSAAQIISYEIPLTLSVVGVILLAGTMSTNRIVTAQSGSALDWFVFKQPLAWIIFFIAATAEANRTPFDMTEADSEIVAGFSTEYSGMRFGFFYFAEYVNVFIVSALAATLFFGGWTAPFNWPWSYNLNWFDPFRFGLGNWFWLVATVVVVIPQIIGVVIWVFGKGWTYVQAATLGFLFTLVLVVGALALAGFIAFGWVQGLFWFMLKTYVFVITFVWMRATLPRVRVDQLMGFAWKWLLPASLVNLFVTATAVVILNPR
jgi:NADH-quinone oxidoreductase subunit H